MRVLYRNNRRRKIRAKIDLSLRKNLKMRKKVENVENEKQEKDVYEVKKKLTPGLGLVQAGWKNRRKRVKGDFSYK